MSNDKIVSLPFCRGTISVHCKLLSLLIKNRLAVSWEGRDWMRQPDIESILGGRRVQSDSGKQDENVVMRKGTKPHG